MIFMPDSIALIAAGMKTESRRLWKPGDRLLLRDGKGGFREAESWECEAVEPGEYVERAGRRWLTVGNLLAVQPGRCKRAVRHVRIERLGRWQLRDLTDVRARAEGVRMVAGDGDALLFSYGPGHEPIRATSSAAAYRSLFQAMHPSRGPETVLWAISFVII